jgi:hypothetical protein
LVAVRDEFALELLVFLEMIDFNFVSPSGACQTVRQKMSLQLSSFMVLSAYLIKSSAIERKKKAKLGCSDQGVLMHNNKRKRTIFLGLAPFLSRSVPFFKEFLTSSSAVMIEKLQITKQQLYGNIFFVLVLCINIYMFCFN